MVAWVAMHVQAEVALKEWAVVCAALRDGRQTVLLRKGGIREPSADRSFHVERRTFALLPSYFHAQDSGRERDLVPAVHAELAALRPPADGLLHIDLHAEVTAVWWLDALASVHALAGMHVLSEACVTDRFHYRRPGLWALHLRVTRLREPAALPDRPGYAGCVSWVHLDEPVVGEGEPIGSDDEHARREAALIDRLGPPGASA
ncbi:MAG TPA: DUF1802 family protein [Nannocystis sp.]